MIGAGLSGSRVLVELARQLEGKATSRPLRIAIVDRLGEFGRGVPYGGASDRKSLLIESLQQTRCPEFSQWVESNPHQLMALRESEHACDRTWYERNALTIHAARYDELFLPRHIFGSYSQAELQRHIHLLEFSHRGRIDIHRREAVSLAPCGNDRYELETSDGHYIRTSAALIAVGSIPRYDPFWPGLRARHAARYVTDGESCGSFRLEQELDRFASTVPQGPVRVAIVGGGASAIESLHTVLTHPVSARVTRVSTLSCSGVLPGNLRGLKIDDAAISPWARERTSARDYVETALAALASERLKIVAARVEQIGPGADGIEIGYTTRGERRILHADFVINCSGAGDLRTTPSTLLRSLGAKLDLRENERGFRLADTYRLAQWPNVFVAGPLLNQNTLSSHVESIAAVFRVGKELGAILAELLLASSARTIL